ncbi:hypothetical protein [Mesorhizobium sp. M0435]|uniref:hypothetical protein n=1 Tax=Mesorhizobium sp. M0435 TaxID=2956944 RepID=UPI00333B1466
MAKIVKRFERAIAGAKPKTGLVGFLVRERLQEVGPKRWVVADDSVWIGVAPFPVTVPVTVIV